MSSLSDQNRNCVNQRVRDALTAGSNTELLKALVEAFAGSWFFTRPDATFAFVNQTACDTLGYTREELMALTLYDVNPTLTPEVWGQLLAMGPFVPAAVRTTHRRKDGSVFPVEAYGSRIILGDENVSVSYVIDLSEEAQTRQTLAEKEHLLKSLLDSAPVVVWFIDSEGRLQLSEGSALALVGSAPGEVVGRMMADVLADLPEMAAATRQALAGNPVEGIITAGHHDFEYRYLPRRDDGGKVIGVTGVAIDVTARRDAERANRRLTTAVDQANESVLLLDREGRIEYANKAFEEVAAVPKADLPGQPWPAVMSGNDADGPARAELVQAIAVGAAWRGTLRVGRDGQEQRVLQASLTPLLLGAQQLSGFVAVNRDVTDQMRAEERLRHMEKLDAVGQLAGGIAHDFNNLLQVILGNADLCLTQSIPETVRTAVGEMREAGKRAAGLVSQLLAFSRNVGTPKSIALVALLEQLLPLLRRLLGEHIRIDVEVSGADLSVWGDESQLEQIVVNLCVNARDAMPEGGRLQIRLARRVLDALAAGRLGLPGPGSYVALEVADTGCGMSPEVQRRIFEPFFTTKPPGVGTGLGLATVYAVAKRHGGGVEVQSQIGKGSRFRVLLRPSEQREDLSMGAPPLPREPHHLRVLLAENDASVREISRRFLVEAGHQVVVARDGTEAMVLFNADGESFDLLVLDAIMPGVNGPEVYRAFRSISAAPVLFVTGHEFNALASLPSDADRAVLRKPFNAQDLAAAIAQLVAAEPSRP